MARLLWKTGYFSFNIEKSFRWGAKIFKQSLHDRFEYRSYPGAGISVFRDNKKQGQRPQVSVADLANYLKFFHTCGKLSAERERES